MTGLRQSELLALRWRDVDWSAQKIRVRRNFVRGHLLTPKSKRGSRSVPLASRVAAELRRHFERSLGQGDENLVFLHPTPARSSRILPRTALQEGAENSRRARDPLQRLAPHLRHQNGSRGVPMRTLQEWWAIAISGRR